MAVISIPDLRNQLNTYIISNGAAEITGPLLNGVLINMVDSLEAISEAELQTLQDVLEVGSSGMVNTAVTMRSNGNNVIIGTNHANYETQFKTTTTTTLMEFWNKATGDKRSINIGLTGMYILDEADQKGLEYSADYSANFTDRSLVDKGYVDSAIIPADGNGLYDGSGELSGPTVVDGTVSTYDLAFANIGAFGVAAEEVIIGSNSGIVLNGNVTLYQGKINFTDNTLLGELVVSGLTDNRIWSFQDSDGTIAFLSDITPPDGNGIYTGNGALVVDTTVTMGANTLTFEGNTVSIKGLGVGYNALLSLTDSGGISKLIMFDNGETYFDKGTAFRTVKHTSGRWDFPNTVSIGQPTVSGNERVIIKGSGTTLGTSALLIQNSASTELFKVLDNGITRITSSEDSASGNATLKIESTTGLGQISLHGTTETDMWFRTSTGNKLRMYAGNSGVNLYNNGNLEFREINTNSIHAIKNSSGEWVFDNDISGLTTPTTGVRMKLIGAGVTGATYAIQTLNSAAVETFSVLDNGVTTITKDTYNLTLNPNGSSTLTEVQTTNIGFQMKSADGYFRLGRTGGAGPALIYPGDSANSLQLSGATAGTPHLEIKSTGVINITSLPTSAAGLSAGDLWNNSGVVNVV